MEWSGKHHSHDDVGRRGKSIGIRLGHRRATALQVPPAGGARHTSARRFTYDVPARWQSWARSQDA